MGQSRDQIRILESRLLQGELTPDEFESLRDEALSSGDLDVPAPESQVIPTIFNEEDPDELEIAAGPEVESPSPVKRLDDLSRLMTPPLHAFDEEEPTDPDSARSADEIEDFSLSMILETQGHLAFESDLMLADVLAALEEDAQEEDRPKKEPPRNTGPQGPSIRDVLAELPTVLRVLVASTSLVCLLLLSLGGFISTMGADEFGCAVAKRIDTVGVWRTYYENLPVGKCSDRAKEVIRAAGLMKAPEQGSVSTAHRENSAGDHHEHSTEHAGPDGTSGLTGLHPLEDPNTRPKLLGAPQIVDDPTVQEPLSKEDLLSEQEDPDQPLSETERTDITYCKESKKINSVDGWRDYLEHFPVGRCAARATHFLDTRSPTSRSAGGVLEQRSTNSGPSDFLVDTIVLNDASVRRCVRVARGRGRDVPTQVGIHFTIHSGGETSGSRLVAPHLSGTSLDSCISEQVNLLRFPPWDGRDRTITYTLDLRRKATLPKRRPSPVQEAPEPDEEEEHHEDEEEAEAHGGGGGGH